MAQQPAEVTNDGENKEVIAGDTKGNDGRVNGDEEFKTETQSNDKQLNHMNVDQVYSDSEQEENDRDLQETDLKVDGISLNGRQKADPRWDRGIENYRDQFIHGVMQEWGTVDWKVFRKTKVFQTGLFVTRIENIDMSEQTVTAQVHLTIKWQLDSSLHSQWTTTENMDMIQDKLTQQDPFIDLEFNAEINGDDITKFKYEIDYEWKSTTKIPVVYAKYKLRGKFFQQFNVEQFPLDCQVLEFSVLSRKDPTKMLMLPTHCENGIDDQIRLDEYHEPATANLYCCKFNPEIYSGADMYGVYSNINNTGTCKTVLVYPLARKWWPYFWRYYIFPFLISVSSVMMLFLSDLGDQVGVCVTLLLTLIAFMFVVESQIPSKAYLTLLEKYLILSFLLVFAVVIFVLILDPEDDEVYGLYMLYILAVFEVLFGVHCFRVRGHEIKGVKYYDNKKPDNRIKHMGALKFGVAPEAKRVNTGLTQSYLDEHLFRMANEAAAYNIDIYKKVDNEKIWNSWAQNAKLDKGGKFKSKNVGCCEAICPDCK